MGYNGFMNPNTPTNPESTEETQLMAVLDQFGITELGSDALKSAILGEDLLSQVSSVLDVPRQEDKKAIH